MYVDSNKAHTYTFIPKVTDVYLEYIDSGGFIQN